MGHLMDGNKKLTTISQATGNYHSLEVAANKCFSQGLQFMSNYVWSHSLSHESYEFLISPAKARETVTITAGIRSYSPETTTFPSAGTRSSRRTSPVGQTRSSVDFN